MDLISIIVPVYKAEKYLDRCLKSITQQTYRNIEVILVDDGSSDRCPEICDAWAKMDSRINVIHQKNSGVSAARNAGLSGAGGRYIMMVDSDDYLYKGMVEALYQALILGDADIAVCEFEKGTSAMFDFRFDADKKCEVIEAETALKRIYVNSDYALQYIAPWGKLYKAELFAGIKYPEKKIFEDIYITHQILYRCQKIAVLPQKLIYYYQHPHSIMNEKFHVGKLDYLEALKMRISFFEEHDLRELASIAYDEYLHSLIWEYSRARDLLADRKAMKDIVSRFRAAYRRGYASKRYPNETARFLGTFCFNPELIIWNWRISSKLKK